MATQFTITKVNLVTGQTEIVSSVDTKRESKKTLKSLLMSGEIMINGYEYCKNGDKSIEYRMNY